MRTLTEIHNTIIKDGIGGVLSAINEIDISNSTSSKPVSIYFLMNYTINPIEPLLKLYLYESGLIPNIVFGNYDNVMQEILTTHSALYSEKFDLIICSLMYSPLDSTFLKKLENVEIFITELKQYFDLLLSNTSSLILINTLLLPFTSENGIASNTTLSRTEAILEINQFVRTYARQHAGRCIIMDWNRYIQLLGESNSIDYRYWYMYKAPFKKAFLSYYASDITKVAKAINGRTKKCLILDCDNTLWKGIIGEDGVSGIKLDNYDYPGKIFYDFQRSVVDLSKRGVIITLCSKNNENDVWEVLENHPHCLLKREHIAAYKINWKNKAENILDLVRDLNIGLDSCVFIDDSHSECELIKQALPEVTVIRVPDPIFEYPTLLLNEGLFDGLTINPADADKNIQYQQEEKRKQLQKTVNNLNDYLASLELKAHIDLMANNEIQRISQLTQKTNQFNLSTRRYTEQQIKDFHDSSHHAIYALNVKDKFGNYGLTGALIAKHDNSQGYIDTFLLSCRILSRNLEFIFLETCLKELSQQWKITTWLAEYIKNDKNMQIQDFLEKANFKHYSNNIYSMDMNDWDGYNINHIKIFKERLSYA